jgi:dihydropteroate synthase
MHMQGEPRTMQVAPRYGDVASEVAAFLEERLAFAVREGVQESCVCLDPGIGFGKTLEHNLALLRSLDRLVAGGVPVVVGASRKGSLGQLTGGAPVDDRLEASVATAVWAVEQGAAMVRVHDVAATVRALALLEAA